MGRLFHVRTEVMHAASYIINEGLLGRFYFPLDTRRARALGGVEWTDEWRCRQLCDESRLL